MNSVGIVRLIWLALAIVLAGSVLPAQDRDDTEDRIRAGLLALNSRDIPTAQEHLEKAIEQAPQDARGWLGLSQIYAILNLHRQAHEHADEAARLDGKNPIVQRALAMFYSDYRNWAEAARWEEMFAESDQADPDSYLRAASMYLEADMPRRAIELANKGVERKESPQLHNVLGKAYETAGDSALAQRHLEKAVETLPYEESLHFDLGYFHLRHQDFEAAVTAFANGRKYFDKSAAIELGIGIAYYGQRRFNDAIDAFLRSAELAPPMEQPHAFLGRVLQHVQYRMDDAVNRFSEFHTKHTKSYLGPFLYGQILLTQLGSGDDAEAIEKIEGLLRESIATREDYWESHFELGVLLEKKRRYEDAERHLLRAVELNSEASKPHYRLARVYLRLGKSKIAKAERELHKQLTEKEREKMAAGGMAGELMPNSAQD